MLILSTSSLCPQDGPASWAPPHPEHCSRRLSVTLLQEGEPVPGHESGLLSNTQKWVVRGDTRADNARDFIGKVRPGGGQEGKGTQENCSALPPDSQSRGFMVMRLVSGCL